MQSYRNGAGIMPIVGLGTDVVECLRIARMIERHGERFLRRVYTDHEIEYCSSRAAATQHYAERWAGKEAVLRALGTAWRGGINFRDIEIRHRPSDSPTVALAGVARDICVRRDCGEIVMSVSHCHTHATATAIAIQRNIDFD